MFGFVCFPERGSGSQYPPGGVFGQFGEAGGLVHGVANDGVFEPVGTADVPGYHVTCGDANAAREFESLEFLAQFAGGGEGVARGVGKRQGSAEYGEGGVALELVDETFIVVHHSNNLLEEVVERGDNVLGGVVDGEGCGADDVDKQDGDVAVLAAEGG